MGLVGAASANARLIHLRFNRVSPGGVEMERDWSANNKRVRIDRLF